MLLLLGGTSETGPIAAGLVQLGAQVLVSTATDEPLALPAPPAVTRRCGRLDRDGMLELLRREPIRAVIVAAHPYAAELRRTAGEAAAVAGLPSVHFLRPATDIVPTDRIEVVADHEEGARRAFAHGTPVLLTIGSRSLDPYGARARRTGIPLFARVLARDDSLSACRQAGIPDAHVIAGKGPFSVDDNRGWIRRLGIGVLVTKESGTAGGVDEKLEAARLEGCAVVVVARPQTTGGQTAFSEVQALLAAVRDHPDWR
jgi:precorrin-6A/cobalt-precorrin-6A reductase